MTLAAVEPRILITGTGTLGPFSLTVSGSPLRFTSNSHIRVTRYSALGVGTVLTEGTDYTLTGGPNAGSLLLTSPQTVLTTSEKLLVERVQPFAQDLALALANAFPSASVEARLDKQVEFVQDVNAKVGRALLAHPLDTAAPVYPAPSDRAGRWAKWDTEGDLVASDPPALATITADNLVLDERYFENVDGATSSWTFANFTAPTGYAVAVYLDGVRQYLSDFSLTAPTATSTTLTLAGMPQGAKGMIRLEVAGGIQGPPGDSYTLVSIAALRASTWTGITAPSIVNLVQNYVAGDGGGVFRLDVSDVSSTDNSGTIIVDASGKRWKRQFSGALNVRWFGALGDGTTNDTTALQAAITAAPTNGGIVFVPPGTYMSNTLFVSASNVGIHGVPSLSIIRRRPAATLSRLLDVSAARGFESNGMVWDGNKNNVVAPPDANVALFTSACLGFRLVNSQFINARGSNATGTGHGILVVGADDATAEYDIIDCQAYGNLAEGLVIWYADNVNVRGGYFHDNTRNGIAADFKNIPNVARRIKIIGATCYNNGQSGIVVGNFFVPGASPPVTTHANANAEQVIIEACHCYANNNYGIAAYGDYILVKNNQCNGNNLTAGSAGGIVFSARYSKCTGNTCANNGALSGYGLDSGGTAYCEISNNTCVTNYINFNPGGSISTLFCNNHSVDAIATGVYVIPVEGGGGAKFPYECRSLVIRDNLIEVNRLGVWGVQILHGVRDMVFSDNHFYIVSPGRLQDAMFWNGAATCVLSGNTHSLVDTSEYNVNESGGILRFPDFVEYLVNTQTNPTVTSLTTWSKDVIADGVAHLRPTAVGSGYTTATVNFSGGGGSGAAASAQIIGGAVVAYHMTAYGTGYTSAPTVTITGDGTGATASAVHRYQYPTGKRLLIYSNNGMVLTPVTGGGFVGDALNSIIMGQQSYAEFTGQFGGLRLTNHSRDVTGGGVVTTTDATVTTIVAVNTAEGQTISVEGYVVARRTGGSGGAAEDGALYRVELLVKNVAGTATIIGSTVTTLGESQAAWDVTIDASGSTARIRGTGALNNNIRWEARLNRWRVF